MSRLVAMTALALAAVTMIPTEAQACAMALPPSLQVADIGNVFDAIDAEADATVASTEALEKENGFVRTPVEMPPPRILTATIGTQTQTPDEPEAKQAIPEVPQDAEQVATAEEPQT